MKRLVVCLDGTWNAVDQDRSATNVVKLMRAVAHRDDEGVDQVTYYDRGVGTAGGWLRRRLDGLTGGGLEENIKDAYLFLANNYREGDEIYLFGFSRGAFTARSLAGMIGASGLLDRDRLRDLGRAWDHYRDREKVADRGGARVRIRCIGVWDTVGSLGIPLSIWRRWFGLGRYRFHDTQLGGNVDHALHAVSVDEKRGAFEPTLWAWKKDVPLPEGQTVEQVWFAGDHCDVGGGHREPGLSDLALEWMVERVAHHTDLAIRPDWRDQYRDEKDPRPIRGDPLGVLHDRTRRLLYALYRFLPFHRVIGQRDSWTRRKRALVNRPGKGEYFLNEMVHASVLERWEKRTPPKDKVYAPQNVGAALGHLPVAPDRQIEHANTTRLIIEADV